MSSKQANLQLIASMLVKEVNEATHEPDQMLAILNTLNEIKNRLTTVEKRIANIEIMTVGDVRKPEEKAEKHQVEVTARDAASLHNKKARAHNATAGQHSMDLMPLHDPETNEVIRGQPGNLIEAAFVNISQMDDFFKAFNIRSAGSRAKVIKHILETMGVPEDKD